MVESKKIGFMPFMYILLLVLCYIFMGAKYSVLMFFALMALTFTIQDIRVGLAGYIFLYPFLPDSLNLLACYGLFALYAVKRIVHKDEYGNLLPAAVPTAMYLILAAFATITSFTPMGSLRDLALHLGGFLLLTAIVGSIENKRDLNLFITVLIVSAALVAFYGIIQTYTGITIRREWLDAGQNPDVKYRVYSVFMNPNIFAEYLVFITPLSVAMFWHTKSMKKKFAFLSASLIMLLALVLSMSRGGWLGIAAAALMFIILVEPGLLISVPLMAAAAFYMLPPVVLNRVFSIFNIYDSSNEYRLKMWDITLDLITDYWKGGVGFGHKPFKMVYETYIRTMPLFHCHNTILQTVAETGISGFCVFVAFIASILKPIIRVYKRTDDRLYKLIAAGLLSSFFGIAAHGMFEVILYIPRIIFTFWIVASLGVSLAKIDRELDDRRLKIYEK